ncbi:Plasminogen (Fragment) [Seminavis robusta]|uniref:Plasminogen n=1 Tax=Seminavis robusta TaxID=568900 RepID=A0A9N8DE74_9STRA
MNLMRILHVLSFLVPLGLVVGGADNNAGTDTDTDTEIGGNGALEIRPFRSEQHYTSTSTATSSRRRTGAGDLDEYNDYASQFDNGGNGTNTIVGGSNINANAAPWFVHFASKTCSGSLISPSHVLTSATCLRSTGIPNLVRVGATNQLNGFLRQVACATTYPDYTFVNDEPDAATITGDLAILKLTAPVPGVTPVTLNQNSNVFSNDNESPPLLALGLGFKAPNLQQLELEHVSTNTCQQSYGANGQRIIQPAMHLCASAKKNNKGLCTGDSGSPLVMLDDNDGAIQVGVASFTYGTCGDKNIPDVFTPVASYSAWIQAMIGGDDGSGSCGEVTTSSAAPSHSPSHSSKPSSNPSQAPTNDGVPSNNPSSSPTTPAPTLPPTTPAPSPPPTMVPASAISELTEQLVVLAVQAVGSAVEWKQTWKQENLPGLAALLPSWLP